jgi:opacity protein-like surface antigen
MRLVLCCVLVTASARASLAQKAAAPAQPFVHHKTFAVFAEYSNDSSHMLMGNVQGRKFTAIGGSYALRILAGRYGTVQYVGEIRPVIVTSDPVENLTVTESPYPTPSNPSNTSTTFYAGQAVSAGACVPGTQIYHDSTSIWWPSPVISGETVVTTCGRRWTFATGLNPVGFKANFMPHHRIQPVLAGGIGYIFSTRPIPVTDAGSFNFAFELGAGVEMFRAQGRSLALTWSYHHYSNKNTAPDNPGVDNGVVKLTYAFGR